MAKQTVAPKTPTERQYALIKARYPDVILLFRVAEEYHLFEDDAATVGYDRLPVAAADATIALLLSDGHKIAVCEPIGEARS